jgi:hypothetical protein
MPNIAARNNNKLEREAKMGEIRTKNPLLWVGSFYTPPRFVPSLLMDPIRKLGLVFP